MPRIIQLAEEELKTLRGKISEKYSRTHPLAGPLVLNTFLANYEGLQKAMIEDEGMPEKYRASVSLKRLRKLFHYTDPEKANDQYAESGFGVDFLDACYFYISDGKANRAIYWSRTGDKAAAISKNSPSGKRILLWLAGVLLLLLSVSLLFLNNPGPELTDFREDFDFNDPDELFDRGWILVDPDSSYWKKQLKLGYLTLYTLRGGYWYTEPDTPRIYNVLAREIRCQDCFISLKISDFNPLEDYQQAGFYLLDKEMNRNNFLRITYEYAEFNLPDTLPQQKVHVVFGHNGSITHFAPVVRHPTADKRENDLYFQNIYLGMEIHGRRVKFFFHVLQDHDGFFEIENQEILLPYEPRYLALAAMRGIRLMNRELNENSTIPAYFDWVSIRPI